MTSDFLLLSLSLEVIVLCELMVLSTGAVHDCINLPRPPLNGRIQYTEGKIKARLKCSKPGLDLPLNAPGQGGVLTCDPKQRPFDFFNVQPQKCLTYVKPIGLRVPVKLIFTVNECSEDVKNNVKAAAKGKLGKQVPEQCSSLMVRETCSWDNARVICEDYDEDMGDNDKDGVSTKDKNQSLLLVFKADLVVSNYRQDISVERYQEELKTIYSKYLSDFEIKRVDGLASGVTFVKLYMYWTWVASCQYGNVTIGTKLALHGVGSCRGCPLAYYLHQYTKSCWRCPRGYWTPEPFNHGCVPCPDFRMWRRFEDYVTICGAFEL